MTVEAKCEETQMAESVVAVEEPTIKAAEKMVVDPSVEEEPTIKDAEKKVDPAVEEEPTLKDAEKKVDDAAVVVAEVNVEEKKEEESKIEEVVEEKKNESGDGEVSLSTPAIEKGSSFKEEAKQYSDLKEHEKKALIEFKSKLQEAILQNKLFKKQDEEQKEKEQQKEIEKPTQKQEGDVEREESKKQGEDEENEKSKQGEDEEKEKSIEAGSEEKEKPKEESGDEEKDKTEEGVEGKQEKIVKEEGGEEKQKSSTEAEEEEEKKVEGESEEEKKPDVVGAEEKSVEEVVVVDKDISIWGVPLLPSKGSEATDVILLKFLRARDFKVNEAFEMLKNTLQWRKDNKMDSILDEDLGTDLSSVAYMDGLDFEGHPICYNMYGSFEDDQLYQKTFGTEEKREQFLRWRFQLMEKGIQKLDFNKEGVSSLLQLNDLKNSPGPSRKELRIAMKQAVGLLQDNYPEFVARNIFVNVPFWYYAFNAVLSPFLTQRTKSKFVFARPAKVTETLLRYIPAEQIPLRYGGLKRENDTEFSTEESTVSELTVKAGSTESIEIPAPEVGATLLWDLTVLGWEVNYKEEFVPADEGSYTIIVQKGKKMGSHEEPVRNSFRNNEPGKVVLTIENGSFKSKKRVLYRYKTK